MNIFNEFEKEIKAVIADLGATGILPSAMDVSKLSVESPRDASHGDLATNAAMVLSKAAGMSPRTLADILKPAIETIEGVNGVEIAGPGFINIRLHSSFYFKILNQILVQKTAFGESNFGANKPVNVEYVSANPTGPMHAGHVRGAVIGDALVHLLRKAGYAVTGEYYFNDAGEQINVLVETVFLRYKQALGFDIGDIPEGLYPGEYLVPLGQKLKEQYQSSLLDMDTEKRHAIIRHFAVHEMIERIKQDLEMIGIRHDVFTNEREIIESGKLEEAFKTLKNKGLIYQGTLPPPKGKEMEDWEAVDLTLFRSSQFGDQQDRALKKRNGEWAYIMPDIAYHHDKIKRGFDIIINVLGTDHAGYLEKMRPAVKALGNGKAEVDVIYNQMVKVLNDGKPVKLSKRSGNIITLRDMVENASAGVVRFFMLLRSPNTELEFDYKKVVEQSSENPVFYVQYAHARCCSVLNHGRDMFGDVDVSTADLSKLDRPETLNMIKILAVWPRIVEQAAIAREPHRVAFYLQEVAAGLHSWWNMGREDATLRFLIEDDKDASIANLTLVLAVKTVIASALNVIGVEPLDELRGDFKDEKVA